MSIEELKVELKENMKQAPDLKDLDGWVPVGIEGERVLARKKMDKKIVIKSFKAEGVWKKAYNFIKEKERILERLEDKLREKHYARTVGEEEAED